MTDGQEKIYQLIIRQRPVPGPELDLLLKTLQEEFGLEAYTARQRLIGPGLAMFGKGPREKTGKVSELLRKHGFACWLISPQKPRFAPDRLRGLAIQPEHVLFDCQTGPIRLERGTPVVAVLADLSGALADKHIKRLWAQNAYRGMQSLQNLSQDEMIAAVYKGKPVLDVYLLDAQGGILQAVRVLPGRFNIEGLGDRAGMSTIKNLQAMLTLVRDYAGDFRVHCDFGLSSLPKCQMNGAKDDPSAVSDNLKSLTRYGWLVARLQGDGFLPAVSAPDEADLVAGLATAATVGLPAFGAADSQAGGAEVIPGFSEISGEIRSVLKEDQAATGNGVVAAEEEAANQALPPPPDRLEQGFSLRKVTFFAASLFVAMLIVLIMEGKLDMLRPVMRYGTAAGVIPGLLAFLLLWSGFYFIRLKRRVENTPTSKVRSIAMGLVEVHGCARRMYALVAPMSQSACVFYRLRKYRRDKNQQWKLVREVDSRHVPFQVDDGTGRVTVDPNGARVAAKTRQTGYPGESALTFSAFKQEYADEKWVEDLIYEGTNLYVLGYARPLKEERMSLADRTRARLRDLKLDRQALHRYDADGDGRIDEVEWQQARRDTEQAALREHLDEQGGSKRQEEHVVIGRPHQKGLPFVIAETVSEAHLIRKYLLISVPLLIAGVALLIFAIHKALEYVQP